MFRVGPSAAYTYTKCSMWVQALLIPTRVFHAGPSTAYTNTKCCLYLIEAFQVLCNPSIYIYIYIDIHIYIYIYIYIEICIYIFNSRPPSGDPTLVYAPVGERKRPSLALGPFTYVFARSEYGYPCG